MQEWKLKLLEENIKVNLHDLKIELSNGFLEIRKKHKSIRKNNKRRNKLAFIKIKHIFAPKDTIKKTKKRTHGT